MTARFKKVLKGDNDVFLRASRDDSPKGQMIIREKTKWMASLSPLRLLGHLDPVHLNKGTRMACPLSPRDTFDFLGNWATIVVTP